MNKSKFLNTAGLTLIPFWALIGIALVIWAGAQPDTHSNIPVAEQTYPLKGIGLYCFLTLTESLMLWLVIRPLTFRLASWGRVLGALLVAVVLWAIWPVQVHGPDYHGIHLLWLMATCALLMVLLLISVGAAIASRFSSKKAQA